MTGIPVIWGVRVCVCVWCVCVCVFSLLLSGLFFAGGSCVQCFCPDFFWLGMYVFVTFVLALFCWGFVCSMLLSSFSAGDLCVCFFCLGYFLLGVCVFVDFVLARFCWGLVFSLILSCLMFAGCV